MISALVKKYDKDPFYFLIKIRDLKTYEPMPGVQFGDLGPKIGNNGINTGYLKFSNYRVPKEALLNRFVIINEN